VQGLGACGPGEVVGVDPGVDGVQHGEPRVVDGPGGELDRVGGVSFRSIRLAGGKLGIPSVGPPKQRVPKARSLPATTIGGRRTMVPGRPDSMTPTR
jgi:hypothetical protein